MTAGKPKDILAIGRRVIRQEAQALQTLKDRIGTSFEQAVELMIRRQGRVVVAGMGKSGQISRKIAATLASTGTPALYIHPSDALHGDLGMLSKPDVLLLVSNSGETDDIIRMLPTVEILRVPIIAILGQVDSTLGRKCDVVLDASVEQEACPMNLAPTTSTTAALVMGDALAMALLELRDFKVEDFALYHPGGALGKKLITTVANLMHGAAELPLVHPGTPMAEAILVISEKGLGIAGVVDDGGRLKGAITDGDLRRGLERDRHILDLEARQVMTPDPKWILNTDLAVRALAKMEDHAITSLFVMEEDDHQRPVGLIHIHDILMSGIRR